MSTLLENLINKKTTKRNMNAKPRSKLIDRYPDLFFMKEQPLPEAIVDRIIEEMREFADRPTTLRAADFWDEKKIDSGYYWQLKDKHPNLKRAYEYLLSRIASRRDHGAMTRKYDAGYIDRNQPMYDRELKEFIEWKAKITKIDEQHNSGTRVVIVDRYVE